MEISISKGVRIGSRNRFECGWWVADEKYASADFARRLILKESSLITSDHHFDVAGELSVGSRTWIAGAASQFWTHGVSATDRNISIGENCYIGSGCKFAPGSGLGNSVLVSLGSVVLKRVDASEAMVAGVPAKVVKENYKWRD